MLDEWAAADAARERVSFQARMAQAARTAADTGHAALINNCVEHYAPRFLPGFEVLYVDDSDGDRIVEAERKKMKAAGVLLTLADPMPDVLLWNPGTNELWVIEAVTSDGEVDAHTLTFVTSALALSGYSWLTWPDVNNPATLPLLGIIMVAGAAALFARTPLIQARLVRLDTSSANVLLALNGSMVFAGQGARCRDRRTHRESFWRRFIGICSCRIGGRWRDNLR